MKLFDQHPAMADQLKALIQRVENARTVAIGHWAWNYDSPDSSPVWIPTQYQMPEAPNADK